LKALGFSCSCSWTGGSSGAAETVGYRKLNALGASTGGIGSYSDAEAKKLKADGFS